MPGEARRERAPLRHAAQEPGLARTAPAQLIGDDALQLRARRQIGYIAVIAALSTHSRDEDGEPIFAIKGGVAVELLMGQEARATKDLNAAVRTRAEEIEPLLRDALARGWDGFSFRLVSWETIHDTAAWRGDIKLQFKGQPFSTVQFEAAPAEGDASRDTQLVDNTFVDVAALGLTPVGELPLVTLAYMLAQKLHACTDHSVPDRDNDRARDLIDILLVRRLLDEDDLADVRRACVEIFRLRDKHPWPPPSPCSPSGRPSTPVSWPRRPTSRRPRSSRSPPTSTGSSPKSTVPHDHARRLVGDHRTRRRRADSLSTMPSAMPTRSFTEDDVHLSRLVPLCL